MRRVKNIFKGLIYFLLIVFSDASAAEIFNRVIVVGIDQSGSFRNHFETAKKDTQKIVTLLTPGNVIWIRFISDRSYDDISGFGCLAIPVRGSTANMYNFREKQKLLILERQQQLRKLAYLKKIQESKFLDSQKTDVKGFLLAASDKFSQYSSSTQRTLIIFSDLADNLNYNPNIDLKGVEIRIANFGGEKDPAKTQELKKKIHDSYQKMGAASVRFYAGDETIWP